MYCSLHRLSHGKATNVGVSCSQLDRDEPAGNRTCRVHRNGNTVQELKWLRVEKAGFCSKFKSEKYKLICCSSEDEDRTGKSKAKCPGKWAFYGGCLPLVLRALETVQNLDEALKPWEESLSNKERTIILKEQSNWKRALEIFEWFKRKGCYELNVIHYNIMLRILGRAMRWDQLQRLWCEMQEIGILPTNATYGTLIDVCSKGGLKREALLWLSDMYKQGLVPDEVTMGVVVQTYKKGGEFRKAEQFFKRWSAAIKDTSLNQGFYSSYTYNTLIDTYGKAGRLKEASDMFAQMLKEGKVPNTVTFNTMIHICGNHGHLEEMASLITKMEEFQCPPDTRTYNILISLYAKTDNIDAASGYFSKMKVAGLVPDFVSYRTLLYALSIRNMVGEVEDLIMEMEESGLEMDEFTQTALTRMYINAGMLEQSWSWFERFLLNMTSECYAANIDAFGECGSLVLAEKAFSCCLARQKLSVLVFNVMVKAYGIAGKHDKACEMFEIMKKYGVSPDKYTYNSVIQILSAAELPLKAKPYVRKMQDEGLVNDCVPYCAVITSFAKLRKLDLAEDLFNEMIGFGVEPDIVVFGIFINAFAEVGNAKKAMKYVNLMESAGFNVNSVICNSLIKLYTKVGYLQEAEKTYMLLCSLEGGPDVYSSNCMIDLYSEHCMVKEAEEIFNVLKRRRESNEFSFVMMMRLYRKVGRFGEAVEIAQEMRNLKLLTDALSYNSVIGLYASNGRLKEAAGIFYQMLNTGIQPTDATFKSLGVGLIKLGASKEAISNLELARRNDPESGLRAWVKCICSIVGIDSGNILQLGGKVHNIYNEHSAMGNAS